MLNTFLNFDLVEKKPKNKTLIFKYQVPRCGANTVKDACEMKIYNTAGEKQNEDVDGCCWNITSISLPIKGKSN